MPELEEVTQAITTYAQAYRRLNEIQNRRPELIPQGDQKTGAIGEFYAKLYVQALYPEASIVFGGNSNKAWDIAITAQNATRYIQVKTTSAFSKYRKLSPIHHGWNELFVLHLDLNLQPNGFWIINDSGLLGQREVLKEAYGPRIDQNNKKSGKLLFGPNRISEFLSYIAYALPPRNQPLHQTS